MAAWLLLAVCVLAGAAPAAADEAEELMVVRGSAPLVGLRSVDGHDEVYFIREDRDLYRWVVGSSTDPALLGTLEPGQARSLRVEADGSAWVATRSSGCLVLGGAQGGRAFDSRSTAGNLPGDNVADCGSDGDGNLWFALEGNGLAVLTAKGRWLRWAAGRTVNAVRPGPDGGVLARRPDAAESCRVAADELVCALFDPKSVQDDEDWWLRGASGPARGYLPAMAGLLDLREACPSLGLPSAAVQSVASTQRGLVIAAGGRLHIRDGRGWSRLYLADAAAAAYALGDGRIMVVSEPAETGESEAAGPGGSRAAGPGEAPTKETRLWALSLSEPARWTMAPLRERTVFVPTWLDVRAWAQDRAGNVVGSRRLSLELSASRDEAGEDSPASLGFGETSSGEYSGRLFLGPEHLGHYYLHARGSGLEGYAQTFSAVRRPWHRTVSLSLTPVFAVGPRDRVGGGVELAVYGRRHGLALSWTALGKDPKSLTGQLDLLRGRGIDVASETVGVGTNTSTRHHIYRFDQGQQVLQLAYRRTFFGWNKERNWWGGSSLALELGVPVVHHAYSVEARRGDGTLFAESDSRWGAGVSAAEGGVHARMVSVRGRPRPRRAPALEVERRVGPGRPGHPLLQLAQQ